MTRIRSPTAMLGLVAASMLFVLASTASASPQGLQPLYLTAHEILCLSVGRWCALERPEAPTAREWVARAVARQAADRRIQALIARTELSVPPGVPPAVVTAGSTRAGRTRATTPTKPVGGCLGRC